MNVIISMERHADETYQYGVSFLGSRKQQTDTMLLQPDEVLAYIIRHEEEWKVPKEDVDTIHAELERRRRLWE